MYHLTVTQKQQFGLAEQFTLVAIIKEDNNSILSLEHNIDNLVTIRFILRGKSDLLISAKNCKEVHAVNIIVTCSENSFSEQWFSTDEWSQKYLRRDIPFTSRIHSGSSNFFTYKFGIYVIASKLSIMGPLLYQDENFTDFRLSTADGSVGVHKASLAVHSDMFKAMLNGEWKETVEGHIEVEGASLQTLQALKDFMYLGKLPEEGLQTLLQIAVRFFIETLKRECIIKLAQNAKPEEYLELLDFARDKEIVELTFALVQLTPKKVVNSAYQMMIKSKQLPEAGDITDKE